ncbi:MAG TPA: AraC family transcriptional regulator ligand-binding domain-containing protein [Polyangiales bacterium]|nr:AraC family transcriptional regulator ligand-binding domain-containing protein [Polyangiales bacterium]
MIDELQADPPSTVALTAFAPFLRLIEESGPATAARAIEHTESTFARWGLPLADLEADPTLRLPYGMVIELMHDFVAIVGDPAAPLRAGFKLQRGDYELLEYLCTTCATLGETIACLGRYYPLLIAAEYELHLENDRAEARFRLTSGLDAPDFLYEFAMASNFTMAALHIAPEGAQLPLEICFSHAPPPYAELFPTLFFAPTRFGCEHNALVFPAAMLEQPMRDADSLLHSVLTRLADQELAALASQSAFPTKVRDAIEAELAAGAALDAVAERLHISASGLRSRLRQHGTTYSALLDGLRRERAKHALRQTQLSFAEVAHDLGFAHPPAFHRAFRRWFGVTPSAYRDAPSTHRVARLFRKR